MCDQTEVLYSPNDVVWVKLGPVWWPGQVQDYDKLPEEITANLRKRPLAVVKFFQEDSFEYVKNMNHIYHYNCRKKNEFIKKGMDLCRSSNSRDVPTNMKMFPTDVATAEHLTGGNPNILDDEMFAPEKKADYNELFGSKKTPIKKIKLESVKKEYEGWRMKALKDPSLNNGRRSLPDSGSIPRPITHPRFITKALEGRSDHEVRIRNQTPVQSRNDSESSQQKQYNCHICGFTSTRLNVIVLHNKSHSAGFAQTSITPSSPKGKKPRLKDYSTSAPSDKFKTSTPKRFEGVESSRRRIFNDRNVGETGSSNLVEIDIESPIKNPTPKKTQVKKTADSSSKPAVKKPVFGKKRTAKEKAELAAKLRRENEAIRDTLLKDWDEDDETQEEEELERLKKTMIETSTDTMCDESSQEKKENDSKDVHTSGSSKGNKSSKESQKSGKEEKTAPKEKSCFDFDDSEDALPLDETVMKFGRKIPRVISDEKPKKRSTDFLLDDLPPCTSVEQGKNCETEKTGTVKEGSGISDKEAADLDKAFKNLLEETSLPVIPDIPKNLPGRHIKNDIFLHKQSSDTMCVSDVTEDNIKEDPETNNCKEISDPLLDQNNEKIFEVKQENVESTEKSKTNNETLENINEPSENIIKPCVPSKMPADAHIENVESTLPETVDQSEKYDSNMIEPLGKSEPEPCKESEKNFQDMNLDINSMPVIISGEDMIQTDEHKTDNIHLISENMEQKYSSEPLSVTPESEIKQENVLSSSHLLITPDNCQLSVVEESNEDKSSVVKEDENNMSEQPITVSVPGNQDESGKPISNLKTTTVKTIKIQPNSASAKLKQLAGIQKGGQSQVLIVKTSSGQQSKLAVNKATLQKLGGAQHLLQQGGKVLILTNTQGGSTQGKLATLSTQSQKVMTSGGKLVTGARIITTKGTVLSSPGAHTVPVTNKGATLGQTKTVITKSNASKVVVTKGNAITGASKNMIINKAGILSSNQTVVTNKTPSAFITTQNILTSKGNVILPNTSQTIVGSSKTATAVVASQAALSVSKGMVLTPITSKGAIVTSNQKVRLVTTKPTTTSVTSTVSGPLLISQSPQSKLILASQQKSQQLKLVSNIKCQPGGNAILIQTSQGLLATSLSSTQQTANKQKIITKTVPAVVSQQSLPPQLVSQHQAAAQVQMSKKTIVQKVKPASPNILQKSQKKSVPRPGASQTPVTNQLVSNVTQALQSPSAVVNSAGEAFLLSSAGGIPVIGQQNLIHSGIAHQGEGTALVYLAIDEAGNYRPLDESALVSFEGTPEPRTLYIESQPTEMDNIFLAIDNSGNVVNIAQPAAQPTSLVTNSAVPSQDILAKALANTQVLQQETIIPDHIEPSTSVLTKVYIEQPPHYPQPSLSNNVLETSLTLNQPIMTPLEVPSAVSPSLSSNFIQSNLLATKSKSPLIRPSMPLLTDDADASSHQPEPVFLLDSSHNIIAPASSAGSQLFQLALNENNIIVTSSAAAPSYEVVTNNLMSSQVNTLESDSSDKKVIKYDIDDESIKFIKTSEIQNNSAQNIETNNFINTTNDIIEMKQEKTMNFTHQVDDSDSQSQNITTTSVVLTSADAHGNDTASTANYAVVLGGDVKQEDIALGVSDASKFSETSRLDSVHTESNTNENSAVKQESLKRPLNTNYDTITSPVEEFSSMSKKLRIDER